MKGSPRTWQYFARPATEDATWDKGCMDVLCHYNGEPLAFMVVIDGKWRKEGIYFDQMWVNEDKRRTWQEIMMRKEFMKENEQLIREGCGELLVKLGIINKE